MNITRRKFLEIVAGTGAGILLSQTPIGRLVPVVKGKRVPLPEEEEYYVKTACFLCPAHCGIEARVYNNRVVGIRGNDLHPITRGGVCAKGLSAIHMLYHPDRLKTPLKRKGDRGSGRWVPVKSDQAIDEISRVLKELKNKGASNKLFIWNGRPYGTMDILFSKFMKLYGSEKYYREDLTAAWKEVVSITQSANLVPAWDIENSACILSIGANLFDGWFDVTGMSRAFGQFRARRGKLIHIDPRYSVTSSKADHWVKIKPGTFYEVVMGIIYVIIKEEIYEKNFVNNYASNFEKFKNFVLKEGRLDIIEKKTGVPSGEIYLIAREFAERKPSIAMGGWDVIKSEEDVQTLLLIHSLNFITGNFETKGGIYFPHALPYYKEQNVEKKFESEIPVEKGDVIFLYYSNPLYKYPGNKELMEILSRASLIVNFSPFMDETAEISDFIIPDHTFLERWQDAPSLPFYPVRCVSVTRPVVNPLFDTVHTGDFVINVAQKIDEKMSSEFPWKDFKEFMFENLKYIYNSKAGASFSDEFESSQIKSMEESGFWIPFYKTEKEFFDSLEKTGGWFDPAYTEGEWPRIIKTKDRKFRFPEPGMLKKQHRQKEEGVYLYPFLPLTYTYGTDTALPLLHEIMGFRVGVKWDGWCEISKGTAEKLKLKDGEFIRIEGQEGNIKLKVKIVEQHAEDIIVVPLGLGHKSFTKFAKNIGENPLRIIPLKFNKNTFVLHGFKVKIKKIG